MKNYFSQDYFEARKLFLSLSNKHTLTIYSLPIKNSETKNLYIDIVWVGSKKPKNLLIHTSGIHGVEGFAGSAVQCCLLDNLPKIDNKTAVVFIHVANPYGMAHLRRFNESNVDLNRNFLINNNIFSGSPSGYNKLFSFLNPSSYKKNNFFILKILFKTIHFGYMTLKESIASGQYDHPKGIFFGGNSLEQGPLLLKKWLEQHIKGCEKITIIDVHTGIGKWKEQVLFYTGNRIEHKKIKQMEQYFNNAIIPEIPESYSSGSENGYPTKGNYYEIFTDLFPNSEINAFTQEFGTHISFKLLQAIIEENAYHNNCKKYSLMHPSKLLLRDRFFPKSKSWRSHSLEKGVQFFNQCLNYFYN